MGTTRREFLASTCRGTTLLSFGLTVPLFVRRSAMAAAARAAAEDRVLVIVQLSGGNDGLNTVIPYRDELYAKNRNALRIPADQVVKIDADIGLHPSLAGISQLIENGQASILQGVGYPNPSRSHFRSMDVWHTASVAERLPSDGWLGRAIGRPELRREGRAPAMHIGRGKLPLALAGRSSQVPSLASLADYKLEGGPGGRARLADLAAGVRGDDTLAFLQRSTLDAYASSRKLDELAASYDTPVTYPASELARKLKLIAQLVDSGIGARIYYASLDGFDTHADQLQTHANLLRELGDGIAAFIADLAHHGHRDRVMVMTFSEFGRRVKENGSRGTDHGAAAPMFLAGGGLRAGPIGRHPSLEDLDEGDLKFHTDFRSVYATLLEKWVGCPSQEVLGGRFDRLDLFSS